MQPYATSLEHVLAEVERLDLLLRAHLSSALPAAGAPGDAGGGLPADPGAALAHKEDEIAGRVRESARSGVCLRLLRLAGCFELTRFDVEALLLALLPEFDAQFERLFAELHGNAALVWPSVRLIFALRCASLGDWIAARSRFGPGAPLVEHGLVRLLAPGPELDPPLLAHLVRVDPRIAGYLLDSDDLDPGLLSQVRRVTPVARLEDLPLPVELRDRLAHFVARAAGAREQRPVVYLEGPAGAGAQRTAEALCHALGKDLLVARGAGAAAAGDEPLRTFARRLGREALLADAAVYWEDAGALLGDDNPPVRAALTDAIERHPGLTFLAGSNLWDPSGTLHGRDFIRVKLPRPSAADQARLWRSLLAADPGLAPDVDLEALTGGYRLTLGQIEDAAATARSLARFRCSGDGPVTRADLTTATRRHANRRLTSMGRRLSPRARWEDLVLPPGQEDHLHEVVAHVRHRGRVMDTWGFDEKLSLGKGVSVLFTGPPGTGKTMAAGVLAGELGLDLHHVDLSAVLSKYIGETEQHLAQLFDEAEASSAILFFDEADTLFGKRTEVKDAHDRNANLQASYMLQRIEAYQGVAILASNLTKNMDEAFTRRIRFIVEFSLPGEVDRRRIWERAFPAGAPRAPDVDLDTLAREVDVAGGHIRNIVLRAAFQAASEGEVIAMRHLLVAVRREYQKMGRTVEMSRFSRPVGGQG
jgi:hypothetical protein